MQITLSHMRSDQTLTVERSGDILILNGESFDLSAIPDGATVPRADIACGWLASDIERRNGELRFALILPHGADAPDATLFPAPVTVAADGPVALPPHGRSAGGFGAVTG